MNATAKRERATPLPPEDRRQAIVEAVVPLLIETGPTVTTRQIAEAADVAEGTIFRVFPDKKALLLAAAEHIVDPDRDEETLVGGLAGADDLESKVVATINHIRLRMEQIVAVFTALRHVVLTEDPKDRPHTPPQFMVEADRRLIAAIATHVFAPHRDEIRVDPDVAARVLRGLVFGMWHPLAPAGDRVSPVEMASILLKGLAR
ncbi:MAG TPA: TetR/AcrR family transcriptional regulator [Acidimicrobiia bacterium]